MGDSFLLQLKCAYCGKLNEDIYYAESSDATDFTCECCKKLNQITMGFKAVKIDKKLTKKYGKRN